MIVSSVSIYRLGGGGKSRDTKLRDGEAGLGDPEGSRKYGVDGTYVRDGVGGIGPPWSLEAGAGIREAGALRNS